MALNISQVFKRSDWFDARPGAAGFIFFNAAAPVTADGETTDRFATTRLHLSALWAVGMLNNVPIGETFQLSLQLQDSGDGVQWDNLGNSITGVEHQGAGENDTHAEIFDLNLAGARRYVRVQSTPVFSGATGTSFMTPAFLLGGSERFPS